jgi:hypothetical protein
MAISQPPRQRRGPSALKLDALPEPLQRMLERATAALGEDFKGLAVGEGIVPGLFPLRRTGVSLAPVIAAAEAFIAALDDEQRQVACFDLESDAWRQWSNIHPYLMRHGVCLDRLDEAQKARALALVRESLSASGFDSARNVMKLNEHIRELTGRTEEYGEWYYWLSLFGTPSATEPWGWQIDGHHLIINCFILGDQIVLTPNFMGSEPVEAQSGKYAGTRVFAAEEDGGYALMRALSPEQRRKATVGTDLPFDVFATAFRDNVAIKAEGIRYDELTAEQQGLLLRLVETYVGRIRPGHAEIRLEEVKAHLHETWFAWIGACDEASPFYYRVLSPVILIEFDHQPGIALESDVPTRNHVHTLVRTPNGNDYGRDLLRQHYEQHDHAHPHSPHRRGRV